jgi:hypothetical protein
MSLFLISHCVKHNLGVLTINNLSQVHIFVFLVGKVIISNNCPIITIGTAVNLRQPRIFRL